MALLEVHFLSSDTDIRNRLNELDSGEFILTEPSYMTGEADIVIAFIKIVPGTIAAIAALIGALKTDNRHHEIKFQGVTLPGSAEEVIKDIKAIKDND